MIGSLDFEKPIIELEKKIVEFGQLSQSGELNLQSEVKKLEERLKELKERTYAHLTPWQRVQIARHPQRPFFLDYVSEMVTGFVELHGDRTFADDKALVTGLGWVDEDKFLIIGHQKGRNAKENVLRNFGSAHPEGYRKAIRLMKTAEKFNLPILVFIDTPGAYPGVGAEERGQAYTIAYNLREMSQIGVPIVVTVIGEGGSGGALGIGIGDRVLVLEHAYYSVISPEGCAAILWKDRAKTSQAAEALKLTAKDLLDLGVIDEVVKEPLGGAHWDLGGMARTLKQAIQRNYKSLRELTRKQLIENRYQKFRKMGVFEIIESAQRVELLQAHDDKKDEKDQL